MDDRAIVEQNDKREDVYGEMCMRLYDLYFGRIGFLELLEKWEEILKIAPPTPLRRTN